MSWALVVQVAIFLAVVAGLTYVVIYVAEGWADWVVFGGILFASMGVIIAYHNRRYPAATTKRSFTRDPDSKW
jgi:hypothetical protein